MGLTAKKVLALANAYTDKSLAGGGAIKGKNCTIKSKTAITGGTRITFSWYLDDGTEQETTMDVMDGTDGKGIASVAVNEQSHLIITYTDGTTTDAGAIEVHSAVDSVNGKTGNVTLDADDVGAYSTSEVDMALADKVDKETGKGLSTNDYTDADKAEVAKVADKADADDVIDWASYDSTNHLILFKNGTTTLFSLDAAAFVKDGMVDDVEISGGNLVITFNTDAGKQDISIPLTDIFDPSNYYTKTATDGLLADKADKVSGATNGNFAGLDASGNLTDSGKKAADFATPADIAGQQNLLKDTVGWTGKNLYPYKLFAQTKTVNGVTFTNNGDGTITVTGTASDDANFNVTGRDINGKFIILNGKYIVSGCPSGGSTASYFLGASRTSGGAGLSYGNDTGNGLAVTVNGDDFSQDNVHFQTTILIKSGYEITTPLVFKPMIRRADISDSTYEPYHESVEVMHEEEIHGVNLLQNTATTATVNGVTFTKNADGSITANGTASANAYITICENTPIPKGDYVITGGTGLVDKFSDYGIFLTIDGNSYGTRSDVENIHLEQDSVITICRAFVNANKQAQNLKIEPMLRKADIEDSAYRPYNPQSIQHQLDARGVLGAKNLLQNKGVAQTVSGVTFTLNADGSVTANGTATAAIPFNLSGNILDHLDPTQEYILSGCPKGGSTTTYRIYVGYDPGNGNLGNDYGDGVRFSLSSTSVTYTAINIFIFISSGAVLNNLVFKPMLRLASDPDNTYQPYAMTNREITEAFNNVVPWTVNRTGATNAEDTISDAYYVKVGKLVYFMVSLRLKSEVNFSSYTSGYKVGKLPYTPLGRQAGSAYISGRTEVLSVYMDYYDNTFGVKGSATIPANAEIRISGTYICQ